MMCNIYFQYEGEVEEFETKIKLLALFHKCLNAEAWYIDEIKVEPVVPGKAWELSLTQTLK